MDFCPFARFKNLKNIGFSKQLSPPRFNYRYVCNSAYWSLKDQLSVCPALKKIVFPIFPYKFTFVYNSMAEVKFLLLLFLISLFLVLFVKSEKAEDASEKWKKKDIRDYTDADVERLYEQWEVG